MNKNGWREVVLGDVIKFISEKIKVSELSLDNFISTENMLPDLGGISVSSGLPSATATRLYSKKDVLFSNIRTYFKKVWFSDRDGGCSNDVLVFRASDRIEPKYLYYILSDNNFIEYTVTTAKGTKMPRGDKDAIKQYSFSLPPLPIQKEIAKILGDLDAKIELNRKMNENLESMAQALFQSWFVDFNPVLDNFLAANNNNIEELPEPLRKKGELRLEVSKKNIPEINKLFPNSFVFNEVLERWIPEGWDYVKLTEISEVKYGKDHKKLNEGKFPCYGSGGVMRYVDSVLCEKHSVLIPRKGTLSNLMYVRNPFWSVDTMFYTIFKEGYDVKFLYYNLKRLNLSEMNVGSAVPSMTTAVLNDLNIIYPNVKNIKKFDFELEQIYLKIQSLKKQTQNLTKLRETLLPQLISGKLEVPAAMLEIEKELN